MDPREGGCTRKKFRLREGVPPPGGIVRYVGEGQHHGSKERLGKAFDMIPSEEQGLASPARNWVGILSSHPVVTRFLCDVLRRSRKLHELITDARPINLDEGGDARCPSVVMLDTVIADCGSISTITQKVRAKFPGSKLVGLASCGEEHVFKLLQLGFNAAVQITDNFDRDITSAITAVLSGSIWAPESAICDYSKRVRTILEIRLAGDRLLTARESQILESVLCGRSNKEIASNLTISERTVKFHVSNILSKVGAERRRELVTVFNWTSQRGGGGLVAPPTKARCSSLP
jgi:DNA-binding NarL/FixJ family response regulator